MEGSYEVASIPSAELREAFSTLRALAAAEDLEEPDTEILIAAQRLLAAIIVAREDL